MSTTDLSRVKYAGFSILALLLVVGAIEGASAAVWKVLTQRALEASHGVDISRSSQPEPGIGFRLPRNSCTTYRYGLHDSLSYKPETPTWELCTNSRGWRAPEFNLTKPPDTFRVVCMGDSHTMGQGVAAEKAYCRLLGDLLERDLVEFGMAVEVIDAGVWGHSSYQGLISYLTFVTNWQPDFVTVSYGSNDRAPLAKESTRFKDRLLYALPGEESVLPLMAYSGARWNTVRVFEFAARTLQEWRYARQRVPNDYQGEFSFLERRSTPVEYGENMSRLLESIQADGAMAAVIGIGIFEQTYRDVLARAAAGAEVPFVPTWEAFAAVEPQVVSGAQYRAARDEIDSWLTEAGRVHTGIYSRYLTIDGGHPSKIGHRIIAGELYRTVRPLILDRLAGTRERKN